MTRDIKDIITDMREIVKPCIAQMLFNVNFEGKGNTDKAEFETEFEMLLTLAERGATVEPQEWISVKDRLPKEKGMYKITLQTDSGYRYVAEDYFFTERNFFESEAYYKGVGRKIIAWQPITEPSPYKGE